MLGFVQRHLLVSVFLVLSALMTVWGLAAQARELWTANLSPTDVAAIGALVFMLTIVVLLYRWDRDHHDGGDAIPISNWVRSIFASRATTPGPRDDAVNANEGREVKRGRNGTMPPLTPPQTDDEGLREQKYAAAYGLEALWKRREEAIFGGSAKEEFAAPEMRGQAVDHPQKPPRLPELEVTRRIVALDELLEAIEKPASDAQARMVLALGDKSALTDTEEGQQRLLDAVNNLQAAFQQIKRSVHSLSEKHHFAFPPIVHNNFRGADAFHDACGKLSYGIQYLQRPITHSQVALLEPWFNNFVRDTEPFYQWVKDCRAHIMLMRAETLERMPP